MTETQRAAAELTTRRRSPQRRHGQRLQVEQLGGRRELLGQDEVAEGHGQHGLAAQPLVADHLEVE